MKIGFLWLLSCFCSLVFLLGSRPAAGTIGYKISLKNPEQHVFQVSMTIPQPAPQTKIAMPAWNALYQVRDFAYRIRDVQVSSLPEPGAPGENLPVRELDKQTWEIVGGEKSAGADSSLMVRYSILWDDAGPFNSQLNSKHAFVNFAEVLMYVPDRRNEPTTVEFEDVPASWHAVAELPAGTGPNSFTAVSYDTLVDAPPRSASLRNLDSTRVARTSAWLWTRKSGGGAGWTATRALLIATTCNSSEEPRFGR